MVAAHVADERQPLLASSSTSLASSTQAADEDDLKVDGSSAVERSSHALIRQEIGYLLRQSPPLVLGFCLESLVSLITVAIAGRLGQVELAIVGQGLMISAVTGSVVALAATSAQVTLSAPIFTAPTQPVTDVGVVLQRTVILANVGMLPIYVLWWNIEAVMLALGQPPSLASGLKNFMRLMTFAMPGYIGMEAGKTFLQSQAMMTPSTWIILILLPIHGALCAALTLHTPLGVYGAALAQITTYYLFGLSIAAWVWRTKARDCWGGFSFRALTEGKGTFCALWLPGICSYSLEWLSFEVVALLAGRLGETAVAAQAGLASLDGFLFMLPYAISVVATARFGNLMGLGQGSFRRLKSLVMASFIIEVGACSCLALTILLGRHQLGYAFTAHRETVELIGRVAIAVSCYQVFDGLQSVAAGILRATGRQTVAAIVHAIAYWGIGIPLAYFLSFHHSWGLVGLWTAQATALATVSVIELSIYFFVVDWRDEIDKVEARAAVSDDERQGLLTDSSQ